MAFALLTGAIIILLIQDSRAVYTAHEQKKSWDDAEAFCVTQGGHLASILNEAENDKVKAAIAKTSIPLKSKVWIGLNDKEDERTDEGGKVEWSSGEKWTNNDYHNWKPLSDDGYYGGDYYNNRIAKNCVKMHAPTPTGQYSTGNWEFGMCDNQYYFVCQTGDFQIGAAGQDSTASSPWTPAVPSIALLCESTSYDLTVTFPKPTEPFAQKNNVKIGTETSPATACVKENVVVQATEIVSKLTVSYTPGGCGEAKKIVNNNDKVEYTAPIEIIVRQQKNNLERSYVYKYSISCTLTRKQTESSDVEYTVTSSAVDKTEDPTAKEYSLAVALNFYNSADTKQDAEFPLTNKETLKGVIEETGAKDAALKFTVQACTLSNSATAGDKSAETATIIVSECPIDESVTIVPDATDQDKFSFETRAITLAAAAANDKYSVHCTLYICLTAEDQDKCVQSTVAQCKAPPPSPPKRRRRNTDGISDLSRTEVVTSMQSFYLLDKAAMMECPQESVYDEVRDKCSFERVFKVRGIFMDNEWSDSYQNTSSSAYANFIRITERRLRALIFVTGADDVIRGARVIGVRRGGVIMDVLFSHAAHVDAATAFERLKVVLFETPPKVTRIVTELKLQRSTEIEWFPLFINNASSINSNILVVVIVAAVAVVALIGGGVTYLVKTRGNKGPEVDIGMVNGGLEKA